MHLYIKKRDHNLVDCYFELDNTNNCLRALFVSEVFDDYKDKIYISDEQYMIPDHFTEEELEVFTEVNQTEFEMVWKIQYTDPGIKFLVQYAVHIRPD